MASLIFIVYKMAACRSCVVIELKLYLFGLLNDTMNKTIKSGVRELLFRMMCKFKEQQEKNASEFRQKQDCLHVVVNFLENLDNVAGVSEVLETIKKLTDSEEKDTIKPQNQYLEEISSLTETSIATLKRIKKESAVNDGIWRTSGKKGPHQRKLSNLDSFDIDTIRNKINEFYIVRKQALKDSIEFSGCHENLRRILLANGFEFEKVIKNASESIIADDWKKMTVHILHVEDKYKERDRITENNLESFIIYVSNDTDTSGSDESLQAEFLDSDFDYDE